MAFKDTEEGLHASENALRRVLEYCGVGRLRMHMRRGAQARREPDAKTGRSTLKMSMVPTGAPPHPASQLQETQERENESQSMQ